MPEQTAQYSTSTIAEMTNGIILASFEKSNLVRETSYQSETQLEQSMIDNLVAQGYQRLVVKSKEDLYANLKVQIETLNQVKFTPDEWSRVFGENL